MGRAVRDVRLRVAVLVQERHVLIEELEDFLPGHVVTGSRALDPAIWPAEFRLSLQGELDVGAELLAAARLLGEHGVAVSVVNVPVIKPLDAATVTDVAAAAKVVVTAENHTVVGGLGSAVAEVLAETGLGGPLRRAGLRDTLFSISVPGVSVADIESRYAEARCGAAS